MHVEPVNLMQIAIASPAGLLGIGLLVRHRSRALGAQLTLRLHRDVSGKPDCRYVIGIVLHAPL